MYEFAKSSLVNNQSRVYKGGSWKDRAYWMSPATRRFLDKNFLQTISIPLCNG